MVDLHPGGPVVVGPLIALLRSHVQVQCCFTSTEAVGLLGTGAQDDHLDFHTAPELCALPYAWTYIYIYIYMSMPLRSRDISRRHALAILLLIATSVVTALGRVLTMLLK